MPMGQVMLARACAAIGAILLASCTTSVSEEPIVAIAAGHQAFLETCEPWDEWAKPAPPFQITGNSWYIGTCGISAVLVTSEQGHILVDTGVPEAAPLILASIRALGFDPKDVRYILNSHEHFDHVGAHAAIAEATGAEIVTSARAKSVIETGRVDPADPQALSGHPDMRPAPVARTIVDGETISVGYLTLTAHLTPGHSPGALSWTWTSCNLPGEPPVCRRIAYVDSLSAVSADSYRFSNHPEYLAQYRASIARVRDLPCDLLITPHPSASRMIAKFRDGTFGSPGACIEYADSLAARLENRVVSEAERADGN